MILGFGIDFLKVYPQARNTSQLPADISYPIAYAQVKECWHIADNYCAIQVFKGKHMLSYSIEIKAKQTLTIPIIIHHPDIHWQYMLMGCIGIEAYDKSCLILLEQQQHQLHVEIGDFNAWVPPGRHILVGFVIAAEWLQKHEDALPLGSEYFAIELVAGKLYQSTPSTISDAMLTDIYNLLHIPYRKGFKQEVVIYAAIANLHGAGEEELPIDTEAGAKAKLEAIHRYIDALIDLEQPVPSIAQLAEKYHIRPQYLSRLHKKHLGYSLQDYIGKRKLAWAATQLLKGTSSKHITYILNYADLSGFSKAFKKQFGVSPSNYKLNP